MFLFLKDTVLFSVDSIIDGNRLHKMYLNYIFGHDLVIY